MEIGTFLLGTGVAGVLLFLWGGLTQALTPWGIRAVKPVPAEEAAGLTTQMHAITPPSRMYAVFDDKVAALLAVKPGAYYNMGRYFAVEFVTQLTAGALLTGILLLTAPLGVGTQLTLVGLMALSAALTIDVQYWNWWGFSPAFTFGLLVNRSVGALLIAWLLVTWIL